MPVVPFAQRAPSGDPAPQVDQSFMAMATAEIHQAGIFGDLFGTKPAPSMGLEKAPQLSSYPNDTDAGYAIEQGFGYGGGKESYIRGEHAQVLGMTDAKGNFSPVSRFAMKPDERYEDSASVNVDMTKFKNIDTLNKVNTTMARAAIAVNRNPIASLGFDPQRTILDIDERTGTHAGAYRAVTGKNKEGKSVDTRVPSEYDTPVDKLWADLSSSNTNNASTVVHESIHRGLEKLRIEVPEAAELLKSLGVNNRYAHNEELITRFMMYKYAGDPEGKITGEDSPDAKQRQQGIDLVEKLSPSMAGKIERLMELAATHLKNRRPGGPH